MRRTIPIYFFAVCLGTWTPAVLGQSGAQVATSGQAGAGASAQAGGTQAGASAGVNNATSARVSPQGAHASSNSSAEAGAHARHARQNGNQQESGSGSASLASGSTLNAELTSPMDAKKNKPGDRVRARSTKPAKCSDGEVIPRGSLLVGHVTEAQARAKGQSESTLGIAFDKAILKNGHEVALNNVSIQALAVSQSAANASSSIADDSLAAGAGAAGGGRAAGGGALGSVGGALGGATNAAGSLGSAAGGAVNTAAGATGVVSGTAQGANGAVRGLDAAGRLASNSQGVFGMPGVALHSASSTAASAGASPAGAQGSLITSTTHNVHLDSGTQLVLTASGSAQAAEKQ